MSTVTEEPTERLSLQELEDVLGPTYRMPQVDLLPPEVHERRRLRSTRRRLVVGLVVLAVLLGLGYALTLQQRAAAADDLAAEQARTAALLAQQAEYAEVPRVYAQVDAAEGALRTAMATDVPWYRYLGDIAATYPEGVWMTELSASVDPLAAAATGGPLSSGGVGTVTFAGTSRQHPQVADWLDVLDGTPGFAGSSISSSTRAAVGEQPVVTFQSSVDVTPEALSGRYDRLDPDEVPQAPAGTGPAAATTAPAAPAPATPAQEG